MRPNENISDRSSCYASLSVSQSDSAGYTTYFFLSIFDRGEFTYMLRSERGESAEKEERPREYIKIYIYFNSHDRYL